MDTQNEKRTRSQLDSDSENETGNATLYPRFLIIESTDPSRPLSKLSPFVIEKMYFVYCDIAEILPKAEIWCSSRGNDEQSTRRITLEVEAVFLDSISM